MKKILLMIIFTCAFINLNAQENTVFVKVSDSASPRKIVIPNEVYNEKYTLEQNEQAFVSGSYPLYSEIFLEFDGFYSQKIQEIEEIRYEKGKKIQLVTTKIPLGEKKIAWVIIITTFLCYRLFSYLFRKIKKEAEAAVGVAVVSIAVIVSIAGGAVAVVIVSIAGGAVVAVVTAEDIKKYFYPVWIVSTIAGMSLLWYIFTPLFLVCSITGIIVGYLLASLKKRPVLSDGPVK